MLAQGTCKCARPLRGSFFVLEYKLELWLRCTFTVGDLLCLSLYCTECALYMLSRGVTLGAIPSCCMRLRLCVLLQLTLWLRCTFKFGNFACSCMLTFAVLHLCAVWLVERLLCQHIIKLSEIHTYMKRHLYIPSYGNSLSFSSTAYRSSCTC